MAEKIPIEDDSASKKVIPGASSKDEEAGHIEHALEKALVRKVDLHLIPILFLLFLCAFIDRINIGNAKIQGLEKDLNLTGNQYNIALFMFFIPYILLEVPSNIILKKIRPSVWLSVIMACWGVCTIGQGLTQSFGGLVICRCLIGFFEAGFFPGCVYLISMYYQRHELQLRINLFFSASIVAGAFSGLLAYAIANMSGIGGYNGWRWIFILEGIFTVIVALFSFWVIPDWPQSATFLKDDERALLLRRLTTDSPDASMDHWDGSTARRCFTDPKIYLGIVMYIGIVTTSYSGAFFTPTILKQLGWTSVKAQVMSIPVYMVATILAILTAYSTDRLKHRFGFIMLGCFVATVGYAILLCMRDVTVGTRYFAVYAIVGGGYVAQPVCIVWLSNNVSGHYKRGISAAMQIGIGNIGGIIASNIYLQNQAPFYPVGFGTGIGLVWMCAAAACVMLVMLRMGNEQRAAGKRDHLLLSLSKEEQDNMGDDHPNFRFTY